MKWHRVVFGGLWVRLITVVAGLVCGTVLGQTNSWTSPASGHWEDATWSLGIRPAADQTVMITNGGSKAVGIFPTTVASFPGAMTVSNLTVSAPSNSQNTLLLNFAGTAVPLQVLEDFEIGSNGSLLNLSSSFSVGRIFIIETGGDFVQQGGTTDATKPFAVQIGGGTVAVSNGVFLCNEMDISSGSFTQSGGSVNGTVVVGPHGTYNLLGGILSGGISPYGDSFEIDGTFNQSGGTNNVIGGLSVAGEYGFNIPGSYELSGGLLTASNAFITTAVFEQSGGVHLEAGTFSCDYSSSYTLTGGAFVAPTIELSGILAIGPSPAASISNTNLFSMQGGLLQLSNCTASLAPLALALGYPSSSAIQFYGSDKLTFADSSTQSWTGSLTISNWNGSIGGGGADQIIFGDGKPGLTLRQLEGISFVNPAGFPPGTWLATILPTGEVVPTTSPTGPTQPNLWTSPTSGNWEGATWSLGVPPASNQTVLITNAGSKAVGISSSTPVNHPGTMTVGDLVVSAPDGGSNTLLLNFSGTNVPLKVINDCAIGTNGSIVSLSSGLQVGGDFTIDGGFVQEGGVTTATNGMFESLGAVAMTNATLSLARAMIFAPSYTNVAFVQSGGSLSSSEMDIYEGTFNLYDGLFSAPLFLGGYSGNGLFNVYDGEVQSPQIEIGSGQFSQYGGTVRDVNLQVGPFNGSRGNYLLNGGVLISSNVAVLDGYFEQSNGTQVVNGLGVEGYLDIDYGPVYYSRCSLDGGFLTCGGIGVGELGSFGQGGGTNSVIGLVVDSGFYFLGGGMLAASNIDIYPGGGHVDDYYAYPYSGFTQGGGVNWITNALLCGGTYELDGGSLIAPTIILQGDENQPGVFYIGPSPAATISNAISIELGGTIEITNSTQRFGAMVLVGDSSINFFSANCKLTFAGSGTNAWTSGVTLAVSNWNGSVTGGGADQLVFGNSVGGLTPAQLQQIQFVNPAGFPPGMWSAKILPTGEVVPTMQPTLTAAVSGTNLLIQWPMSNGFVLQAATNAAGPFQDVSNAFDPFTNDTTQFPQRFFRLRQGP